MQRLRGEGDDKRQAVQELEKTVVRLRSERDAAAAELQKLKQLISQGKPPRQKEGPRKNSQRSSCSEGEQRLNCSTKVRVRRSVSAFSDPTR